MKSIISGFTTIISVVIAMILIFVICVVFIGGPTWLYVKFNEPLFVTIYVIHFIMLCWIIGNIDPDEDKEYTDDR